jgi:hypothetical protein
MAKFRGKTRPALNAMTGFAFIRVTVSPFSSARLRGHGVYQRGGMKKERGGNLSPVIFKGATSARDRLLDYSSLPFFGENRMTL